MVEYLNAGVHYGDWKGTVAADEVDHRTLRNLLLDKGAPKGKFLVALDVYYHPASHGLLSVTALYADADKYESVDEMLNATQDLELTSLEHEFTFEEFFRHFKQFNVMMLWRDLKLQGREYSVKEA